MTVKELIEYLSTLDPELRVFTTGYEGGFEDAYSPEGSLETSVMTFALNYHKDWWYGPHEDIDRVDEKKRVNYETVKGIVI